MLDEDLSSVLAITGSLPGYNAGTYYNAPLQVVNSIGKFRAEILPDSRLPPGAYCVADNFSKQVHIRWEPFVSSTGSGLTNGDFSANLDAWQPVPGFFEENGGLVFSGVWGRHELVHQSVPAKPGDVVTASIEVQQGASSAGNAGAGCALRWYKGDTVLTTNDGNMVMRGKGGAWHTSTVTATAPAETTAVSFVCVGIRNRQNKALWADDARWDHSWLVGVDISQPFFLHLKVTDSRGRVAYWSGFISTAALTPTSEYRWLSVDSEDTTDYSLSTFNDSAWAMGPGPFGWLGSDYDGKWEGPGSPNAYDPSLPTTIGTVVADRRPTWLRRNIELADTPEYGYILKGWIEDNARVWINDVSITDSPVNVSGGGPWSKPVSPFAVRPNTANSLAIRANDEAGVSDLPYNAVYYALKLEPATETQASAIVSVVPAQAGLDPVYETWDKERVPATNCVDEPTSGLPWANARCLRFDGSGGSVISRDTKFTASGAAGVMAEIWINPINAGRDSVFLDYSNFNFSFGVSGFQLYVNASGQVVLYGSSPNGAIITSAVSVTDGAWHFVRSNCEVLNTDTVRYRLWVDGVLQGTVVRTGTFAIRADIGLGLGSQTASGGTYQYIGRLASARITIGGYIDDGSVPTKPLTINSR